LNRDRGELMEQIALLTRQKTALAEELIGARKESERQSDAILRQAKAKEELMKEKAELAVQITACERENRQQSEVRSISIIHFTIHYTA
jgi:rootletin